ncbi:MAG: hypothetical protein WAP20_08870 [Limnochordia bacterium]
MSKRNKTKKRRIAEPQSQSSKIPREVTEAAVWDYSEEQVVFSFKSCDTRQYQLRELTREQLACLENTLVKMSKMKWKDIPGDHGLDYGPVTNPSNLRATIPQCVPPDCRLDYFDTSQKIRIFGYRYKNVFYIVWFDKNHVIYP